MLALKSLIRTQLLALAAFLQLATAQDTQKPTPLRIGYQSSPPYQIIAEDGTVGGIAIEIVRLAAARLDIELEWVFSPESPDFHFAAGDVDLWPVVTDLPERRDIFYITKPIYQNSIGLLSLDSNPIHSPSETAGKRVAYFDREPSLTLIPKLLPNAIRVPKANHVEAIDSVLSGENHAAFLWSTKRNSIDFKRAVDAHPESKFHFYSFPQEKLNCGLGASFTKPAAIEAADRIREEIRLLVQEGAVQTIYFRYYLDPENEISSYFYLDDLEIKTRKLTLAVTILLVLLAILAVMALVLRKSQQKAKAASLAKSEFLANMSHEFRTPLNGIMGMTQLAIATPLNEEQKELLDIVMQSANSLLTVVNDILDLSKIESGRLAIEAEPLALSALVESTIPFFELIAAKKGLEFEIIIDPNCPKTFVSDIVRLRQILFNLIGNAVKFTYEGKVTVTIDVLQISRKEKLLIEVADTGVGIPESLLSQIFEAFTQGDTSLTRGYGGTGLGLTISHQLTKLLSGELHVASETKSGSVFTVVVPLVRVKSSEQIPTLPTFNPSSRAFKILVVDDNPMNLQTMTAVLKLLGHEIETAEDGATAVKLCETTRYDLIFMDLQMPIMDGWDTTRAIRTAQDAQYPCPPIIALTASIFSNQLKERVHQEMDGLIFKPFEIKNLQNEIIRHTRHKV